MQRKASNTETIGGLTVDTDGTHSLEGDSGGARTLP